MIESTCVNDIFRDYNDITDIKYGNKSISTFRDEDNNLIKPLKKIYMSENNNEMYLILDITNIEQISMNENYNVFKLWESYIMCFINYGKNYRDNLYELRYNITLIFICNRDNDMENYYKYEKSTDVCRKIFVRGEVDGEKIIIENEDLIFIPFYFSSLDEIENISQYDEDEDINNIREDIKKLIPSEESLKFLLNSVVDINKLKDNQISYLKRWLEHEQN